MEKTDQKLAPRRLSKKLRLIFGILLLLAFLPFKAAQAQISIISDEETEQYLAQILQPIFKNAGIPFNRNKIYIVNDNSLNAFVSDGNDMFVHTGTLIKANNSDEISGVLAHETGHIMGGHILRQKIKNQAMQEASLASFVLAGAAAAATGRGDVALAVMMGSQSSMMNHYLAYRVEEERSADDAAIKLLKQTHQSPEGMLEFMKKIQRQNTLNGIEESNYFRTHPMTSERVAFMERAVKESPYPPSSHNDEQFNRIKAKLTAFLEDPAVTLRKYPASDHSIAGQYARAIAYFKQLKFNQAQQMMDKLLAAEPNNPYFHELKAQIYMESGQLKPAESEYKKALDLRPGSPLLQLDWAQAALQNNPDQVQIRNITNIIQQSLRRRPTAMGWLLLSQAYDMAGKNTYATYATAEYNLRLGMPETAERLAKPLQKAALPSSLKLKVDDLLNRLKQLKKDNS